MGSPFSFGVSAENTSFNQTQNKTETQNTTQNYTPIVPTNIQSGQDAYFAAVNALMGQASDPAYGQSLIPGQTGNQTLAYQNAAGLGGWNPYLSQAASLANSAAGAGATPSLSGATNLGAANAAQVSQLPYAAAYSGTPVGAATPTQAAFVAPAAQAVAPELEEKQKPLVAASLLDNLSAYQNPYINDVVSTSLQGFDDDAGRQKAALAAQGALSGAFGGSRFGLAANDLTNQLAKTRAATEAGLRSNAFDTAANLSNLDTDRRQAINIYNRDTENGRSLAQAQLSAQTSQFNAAQQNAVSTAGMQNWQSAANQTAAAQNAVNLAQAGYFQDAGIRNSDAVNQYTLAQAGWQ